MTECIYKFAESALKGNSLFFSYATAIIIPVVSFVIYVYITKANNKVVEQKFDPLREIVLPFSILCIMIIFLILIVSLTRDQVYKEQITIVEKRMGFLVQNIDIINCESKIIPVNDWNSALKQIELCPKEIGYIIACAEYLVADYNNFEAAAKLLWMSMEYLSTEKVPSDICNRLKAYHKHIKNDRWVLDENCNKIVVVSN